MTLQVNLPFNDVAQKELILAKLIIFHPSGIWEKENELVAYFSDKENFDRFVKANQDLTFYFEQIKKNVDWVAKSQSFHRIIKLKPFVIAAPFLEKKVELKPPYKFKIVINPALAFGTGSHPTTKMCIKYLSRCVKKGASVLDMGTGSAILSIVAEKLGATRVVGVDIDETALKEAEKNIKKNRCKNIYLTNSIPVEPEEKFDLVVCNILFNDIIKLEKLFASRLKKGGDLILSGLLYEQKMEVLNFYSKEFKFINSMRQKDKNFDWVAMFFKKL